MLVIYLDGIVFGDYHVLAAVGVDADGRKHVASGKVVTRAANSPWRKSRIRPGRGAVEFRTLSSMAMGKRPAARQGSPLWVETADLPTSDGHPFFERLNRVLEDCGFDSFVEGLCSAFYAARLGRPSLRPGRYFRMLLIGYFEGLSSERGIAWRVADSLSLRSFLGPGCDRAVSGSLDAVADASADRRGDARGGFHVGSGAAG